MTNVKKPTKADWNFYQSIKHILEEGQLSEQARPVYKDGSTANSFYTTGYFQSYDLASGDFPITTLRPIAWKSAIKEMLWIYQDQSNSLDLLQNKYNVNYWNAWEVANATANNGDLRSIGNRYGYVVKKYDIINNLLKRLKDNPWNRRNVISLWDYDSFDETEGLYPCAFLTMFDVRKINEEIYLDCTLVQRSNDMLVAHHINAIQYVALQLMIACHFGWKVGKFNYFVNNLHIYDNQLEQAEKLMQRYEDVESSYLEHMCEESTKEFIKNNLSLLRQDDDNFSEKVAAINELVLSKVQSDMFNPEVNNETFPRLKLNCPAKTNFYDIKFSDFELENYDPIKPQIVFDDLAV